MKVWLLFLITAAVTFSVTFADVIENSEGYKEDDRFFYFPGDGDGIFHLVDTETLVDHDFIKEYATDPNNNEYWLYTRDNPTEAQVLVYQNPESVTLSKFNSSKVTIFLSHGWKGDGKNPMNKELTQAFLQNDNVNVIVHDWSGLANKFYLTARNGVAAVGKALGQFIVWLKSFGLSLLKTHLVGFSLGGHVVGNAGKETGGLIRRITGLDPAGPLFHPDHTDRITNTDAQYVEIIHTTTIYGYHNFCGNADFYPNGGSHMPGCLFETCSHSRAYEYMASTVETNHLHANMCNSLRDAERNSCQGPLNPMGNSDLDKSGLGIFRVNTKDKWPF